MLPSSTCAGCRRESALEQLPLAPPVQHSMILSTVSADARSSAGRYSLTSFAIVAAQSMIREQGVWGAASNTGLLCGARTAEHVLHASAALRRAPRRAAACLRMRAAAPHAPLGSESSLPASSAMAERPSGRVGARRGAVLDAQRQCPGCLLPQPLRQVTGSNRCRVSRRLVSLPPLVRDKGGNGAKRSGDLGPLLALKATLW